MDTIRNQQNQDQGIERDSHHGTPSFTTSTTVTSDSSPEITPINFENGLQSRVHSRQRSRPRPCRGRSTKRSRPTLLWGKSNSNHYDYPFMSMKEGLGPHIAVQRLLETNAKQERLLAGLVTSFKIGGENTSKNYEPSFSPSQSALLEKYLQVTSRPDPVRLCDIFLTRFNLPHTPHMLTASYDHIEMIHMHGWAEQEEDANILLIVQVPNEVGTKQLSQIRWRHIDQAQEPLLAQQVARLAPQVKQQWIYQGRSVWEPGEVYTQVELDETVNLYRLMCPGSTKTIVYQSSYDASGSHVAREPWLSGNRSLLGQLQPYDDRLRFDKCCPWDGRVFGRIWQTFHDDHTISFACIYLVLAQMGITGDTSQRILGMKKALRFLSCYAAKWPRFMQTNEVWLTPNWLQLQLHLRVLSIGDKTREREPSNHPEGGLRPHRVTGIISSLDGMDDFHVIEQRFSIALVTSYKKDLPVFMVQYLTDSKYRRLFVEGEQPLDVRYHGPFTAVVVYIKVLRCVLPLWEQKWTGTLNAVDNLVGVNIDELFNLEGDGAAMMFDSSFARSRLYFTVLQALRIFSEWIQESERTLQQLRNEFEKAVHSATKRMNHLRESTCVEAPPPFEKEIGEMRDEILACHRSSSKCLLERIEKKNEEIKSFRDGLFSATSVREASRATTLNQYILVFTFVTIFYLPLSYASSLFSMDVFSYADPSRGQTSFLVSTAMIAIVTWIASGIVLWVVHDDERVRNLMSYMRTIKGRATTSKQREGENPKGESDFVFQTV